MVTTIGKKKKEPVKALNNWKYEKDFCYLLILLKINKFHFYNYTNG